MPKAKKLPSGSWRCRVFSHQDSAGVKHYESFTAATKTEAELMASQFKANRDRRIRGDLTVAEALEGYIAAKEKILSPSTIRGYRSLQKHRFSQIERKPIKKLTNEDLQLFVASMANEYSPKMISNVYGLLSSALSMYQPDTIFRVTLPTRIRRKTTAPSDDDIQVLFRSASPMMKTAIALAAFGSLRRGEICAVTYGDLHDGYLSVHADVIQNPDGEWVLKPFPKTSDSVRDVPLPAAVIKLIGTGDPDDRISKYKNPTSITNSFIKLRDRLGLQIRFHDLRHYYASVGAVLGVPDVYLASFGGWRNGSSVMKQVYQSRIAPASDIYANTMTKHFDGII